jgi:hypothetical protein
MLYQQPKVYTPQASNIIRGTLEKRENTVSQCFTFGVPFSQLPSWQQQLILAAQREGFSGNSENL